MAPMSTPRRILAAALCALVAAALAPTALAGPSSKKKKKKTFYYQVTGVRAGDGVADKVSPWVGKQLRAEIGKRDAIVAALPDDAPDPKADPGAFKKYLTSRSMRAFKVNVEITSYSQEVVELPAPRSGHHITVSVGLRMFGETIPDRVMAFTGDGSATVKIEVGKRVRDRDIEVANHDAIELAVAEAIDESLVKLGQPPPGKPKK
jgi:hypothetical protein